MAIATKTGEVKFVRKGRPGAMPYPCGSHDPNVTYECTETTAPFVEQDGQYYLMVKVGAWCSASKGVTPKDDYRNNRKNATWILMEKIKAIITEMFFTEFAKLGSAIFHGNYMFSQWGEDRFGNITKAYQNFIPSKLGQSDCPFTPNVYIDWLNGNARLSGILVAEHFFTPTTVIPRDTDFTWDSKSHTSTLLVTSVDSHRLSHIYLPNHNDYDGLTMKILATIKGATAQTGYAVKLQSGHFVGSAYTGYILPPNIMTELTATAEGWYIHNAEVNRYTN